MSNPLTIFYYFFLKCSLDQNFALFPVVLTVASLETFLCLLWWLFNNETHKTKSLKTTNMTNIDVGCSIANYLIMINSVTTTEWSDGYLFCRWLGYGRIGQGPTNVQELTTFSALPLKKYNRFDLEVQQT